MSNNRVKIILLVIMIGAAIFLAMEFRAAIVNGNGPDSDAGSVAGSAINGNTAVSSENPGNAIAAQASSSGSSPASSQGIHMPTAPAPRFNDAATLVMDMESGKVIEGTNVTRRWPTASLAKLMSATIIFDKLSTSTQITITQKMFEADPDEATLEVGGRYTVADLLKLMLLPSSNVAAEAAADFYGHDAFISEMNARAAEWGMVDTHYDDPSGISSADESTVTDLAKLAQVITKNYAGIWAIGWHPTQVITELGSGRETTIRSINEFAGTENFIGGKTGHTVEADGNLLSVFNYNGRKILIIVLGSSDRFGDTRALLNWYTGK